MITASNLGANTVQLKTCALLMDSNPERRALRKKIMALHGVEMIGAGNLEEAALIWHRDRYDMVLIDIRRDYSGALALRNEIKKESPGQIVAFLVGKPDYVSLDPAPDSYVPEQHGAEWGEAMRKAMEQGCESLPQRNGFVEAGFRIASAKRRNGSQVQAAPVEDPLPASGDTGPVEEAG
jgi:CheY-like chemotaxis protein